MAQTPSPDVDSIRIRPRDGLDVSFRPPGSRSVTNRALVAAALAPGRSRVEGVTASDDALAMRSGLERLGVTITGDARTWTVDGSGGRLAAPTETVDVRASGTTARFLTAVATLAAGPARIDGIARMRERPIDDLVDALAALGAPGRILGRGGCPPVEMAGGGLPGGEATIDASRSSQFVSGLLLAAPCAERDVVLHLRDGALVSRPFVDLTLDVMAAFGAEAGWLGDASLRVAASGYRARDYAVEPDAQAAVYGFAAAAITGGRVRVEGLGAGSVQGDLGILEALAAMGCRVSRGADAIEIEGSPTLRGVDVDGNGWPDAALALAVVAMYADGPTEIRGLAHLRIKETDRLAALENEITRMGARATASGDVLRIEPGPLHGAAIETYDDHRMAMSFALAGLRTPGVTILEPGCVAKTWPDFFDVLDGW